MNDDNQEHQKMRDENIRGLAEKSNIELINNVKCRSFHKNENNFPLPERKILNFEMAAEYLGISKSHLYKLTSTNRIEFYRPMGKLIFFNIDKLDEFLMQNKIRSVDEINIEVSNFKLNHKNKVS